MTWGADAGYFMMRNNSSSEAAHFSNLFPNRAHVIVQFRHGGIESIDIPHAFDDINKSISGFAFTLRTGSAGRVTSPVNFALTITIFPAGPNVRNPGRP